MNEQHFDALPPVSPSLQPDPQATQPDGKVPLMSPSAPAPTAPSEPATPVVNPLLAAMPASDPVGQATADGGPAFADDVDLIEKEWVEKAKQIVEQTKHDPYKQNEEMMLMKTDYLKKRYNRHIKKSDTV